ncbi:hypothetical protein SNE40_007656 [Patella caerulea]|uniref:BZIP domain-containing protein n=1 Tax=Patella caerulea TaxID=87958 RepID=A0AAN8PXQ9_PATCE
MPEFGEGEKPIKGTFFIESKDNTVDSSFIEDTLLHDLDPSNELAFDLSGYLYTESKNIKLLSSDQTTVRISEVGPAVGLHSDTSSFVTTSLGMTDLPKFEDFTTTTADEGSVWDTLTVKTEDIETDFGIEESTSTSFGDPASPTVSSSSTIQSSSSSRPKPYSRGKSKKVVVKGSEEYSEKRSRNNVAVRKSRAKAKERQKTTESRVQELSTENDRLQKKIDLLTKELNVLKGLFVNVGAALPESFTKLFQS